MGTSIELRIGNVSLSYSKNFIRVDYGFLFQEGDIFRRKTDAINYDYYENNPEERGELDAAEELFARTLSRISPRLDLLGLTIDAARAEYQAVVAEAIETDSYIEEKGHKSQYLTFEQFCNLACRHPISDLKNEPVEYNTPNRDTLSQGRFSDELDLFEQVPKTDDPNFYWSEASFLSTRVCILSAEAMLQIFALNPANAEVEVTWEFGPIVHAGWVQREEFHPGARKKQKILIATEGASDARIIRRSLDILHPEVADFFHFIDVDERHHFWGASNLVKFAEGLLRIDVLNQVLFIFDNDAEGVDAFRKFENMNPPANMRAMLLPDLVEFRKFAARGPEGVSISDINGRAAAIECYLDLKLDQYPAPQITWSNFKKEINAWHGALDFKESYSKHFYDQPDDLLRNGSYDVSKLLRLLDELLQHARLVTPVI